MKIKPRLLIFSSVVYFFLSACSTKENKSGQDDSYISGSIYFSADESFAPILDQEIYVFKASNKEAKPKFIYTSENDALRLLLNDSVRVAILARNLKPEELKLLRQKNLPPEINCFAHDAVTIIVNQTSTDTLMSVSGIKAMLNGKAETDKNIVFDNPNSSLIRYLKDLAGVSELHQKNVYSLNSNIEVIKYVSEHAGAIGFISYSWLLEPDKNYANYVNKIKIVGIKNSNSNNARNVYFKPSQNTLAMQQYPLVRDLYIINSTGRAGLGTGFASFILSDRGQRIILRSGLLPDSIPTREITFSK